MEAILLIHTFSTVFMTGLCWFIQIAHYPLFYKIEHNFSEYERKNVLVTAYVTVPMMVVELLTGLYLLYIYQDYLYLVNLILFGIIGLSTLLFQAPIHLQLMTKVSAKLIKSLIQTNWIRTISWTIRSGIMLAIIYEALNP